jgi:UDP-N-acetylmuramate dehydrogenase
VQIQEHVPLAPFTTLRIGGPACFFARASTEAEVLEAVRFARERNLPIFVLGGGSNLVVSDSGFPGLVLQVAIAGCDVSPDGSTCEVAAGVDWDAFVLRVCEQGISGVECLAGIPGCVGGTPVQNVGAYGQEVAETIASVRALDLESLAFVELPREQCRFAYRRSIFNSTHRNRYVVTRVTFAFDPAARPNLSYADLAPLRDTQPTPLDVYGFVRTIRDRKGMLIDPVTATPDSRSAGSFFKNPVVAAATL